MGGVKHRKILIFIPAYNLSRTIGSVIDLVREKVPESFILVIDDGSKDNTLSIAEARGVRVISHSRNMGYGFVQKTAFKFFVDNDFSVAVMIHGDGQHNPQFLPHLIKEIERGIDICLGSRMANKFDALKGGMPLLKFFVNIFLTYIENKTLGTNLSEFHSGFRSFSKRFIHSLYNSGMLNIMSNSYIFDQQIIFFAVLNNFNISEVPVDTRYDNFSSQINLKDGLFYSYYVILMCLKYIMFKKGFLKFEDVMRI